VVNHNFFLGGCDVEKKWQELFINKLFQRRIMNVGMLYELLDRLPARCDQFKVRFSLVDRAFWIQSECWYVDEDDDLIFSIYTDEDHEEFTVEEVKDILSGTWNDEYDDQDVFDWQEVYIEDVDDDEDDGEIKTYYEIIANRFQINWKRQRVDVFIKRIDFH
jgi:hypothetical protein